MQWNWLSDVGKRCAYKKQRGMAIIISWFANKNGWCIKLKEKRDLNEWNDVLEIGMKILI